MERTAGIEPVTFNLASWHSTNWAMSANTECTITAIGTTLNDESYWNWTSDYNFNNLQKWWNRRESNSRPFACKANALPIELRPHIGGGGWSWTSSLWVMSPTRYHSSTPRQKNIGWGSRARTCGMPEPKSGALPTWLFPNIGLCGRIRTFVLLVPSEAD